MSSVHPRSRPPARERHADLRRRPLGVAVGQIVAEVRDALFAKKLKPGDFLGTEKDLAARFGVSRIVARDALRTLRGARHRRDQDGQGRRRAGRARQSAAVRRGARRAARPHRRQRRGNHRRAARDRDAGGRARRRARDRRRPCAAQAPARGGRSAIIDDATPTRALAATSISRWPKPRTTACW